MGDHLLHRRVTTTRSFRSRRGFSSALYACHAHVVLGCVDTPNWRNKFGATCNEYAEQHCSNGAFREGHTWTRGTHFSSPEEHCCACYHAPCIDSPGWKNKYGGGCDEYARLRCRDGAFLDGEDWSRGAQFD